MAIFNNMSITNKGQALYAKVQAGIELKFTKMMVGSGDIDARNPDTLLDLIKPKYRVGIQSMTPNTEAKTALISGTIDNRDMTEAVYICEIGLYAQDPDEGEILYAYGTAGKYGDYYAPASRGPFSWNYQINAAIGNAANISIILSNLTYDYGVTNTNSAFLVISGTTQKEINKSIDNKFKEHDTQLSESMNILTPITGSTANAILLNIATLTNNKKYSFKATSASTGNVTINGKALKKLDGTQIGSGGIKANKVYDFYYDSASNCVFILAKAEGDATVADVLATKRFSNGDDTGLTGTMPNNGAVNQSLAINGAYTIPKGYHDGTGKVTQSITTKAAATITPGTTNQTIAAAQYLLGIQTILGDTDLIASNIIAGKNIFNVAGTASVESLGGYKIATGTAVPDKTSNSNVVCSTIVFPFKNVKFFACTGSGTAYNGDVTHTGLLYTCLYNDAVGMYVWYEGYSALTSSIWDPSKIIICKPSLSPIKSTTGSFTWIAVGN